MWHYSSSLRVRVSFIQLDSAVMCFMRHRSSCNIVLDDMLTRWGWWAHSEDFFKDRKTGKNIAVAQLSTACSLVMLFYLYRWNCFKLRQNVETAFMQKIRTEGWCRPLFLLKMSETTHILVLLDDNLNASVIFETNL